MKLPIRARLAGVVAAIAIIRLWAGTAHFYFVQGVDNGSQLFWNRQQAFLVVGTTELGWIKTPFGFLKAFLYGLAGTVGDSPTDRRTATNVFHFRSGQLSKRVFADLPMGPYTVLEGQIYGPAGRWSGDRFETLTPEERERHIASRQTLELIAEAEEGWNVEAGLSSSNNEVTHFPMRVVDEDVAIIVRRQAALTSIQFRRAGRSPEDLLTIDRTLRWVTKSEYDSSFIP
jgi:hypothetical protein